MCIRPSFEIQSDTFEPYWEQPLPPQEFDLDSESDSDETIVEHTPLHDKAKSKDINELIKFMLDDENYRFVGISNETDGIPLQTAIAYNRGIEFIDGMARYSINYIDQQNEEMHNTSLHTACMYRNLEVATLLVRTYEADITITNAMGCTPLQYIFLLYKEKKWNLEDGDEVKIKRFIDLLTENEGIKKNLTEWDLCGYTILDYISEMTECSRMKFEKIIQHSLTEVLDV